MNKEELRKIIKLDKENYFSKNKLRYIYEILTLQNNYRIFKSIYYSRKYQYYLEHKNRIINKILFLYYCRKNNKYSQKNQLELYGSFGKNLKIYHSNVIINKNAKIENNVKFHGNNCIGSKETNKDAPQIGNGVDIGFGAVIIGKITIADDIIIGSNSLVNKDFLEPGVIIAGSPAKIIGRRDKNEKK